MAVVARRRSKVLELSIFTVGIGVILAALTLWLAFALQPSPGQQRSTLMIAVPLLISAVMILLGILTSTLKSPAIVTVTIAVVAFGFLVDLVVGFNVIKAAIDALVIALLVKTGREALIEVKTTASSE